MKHTPTLILTNLICVFIASLSQAGTSYCETLPSNAQTFLEKYDEASVHYQSVKIAEKNRYLREAESGLEESSESIEAAQKYSSELKEFYEQMRNAKDYLIISLLEHDKEQNPKARLSFEKWLECDQIRERVAKEDIQKPVIQESIRKLNAKKNGAQVASSSPTSTDAMTIGFRKVSVQKAKRSKPVASKPASYKPNVFKSTGDRPSKNSKKTASLR